MTTPPPWPATSAPTPPAPSGYEATPTLGAPREGDNPFAAPAPERAAGSVPAQAGYLAQTYPAGGYAPAQDEWAPAAPAYGTGYPQPTHGSPPPSSGYPQPPSAGYPQPYPGQGYAGQPYAGQPYAGQPYAGQPGGNLPAPYPFTPGAYSQWVPPPNDSMSVAALVVGLVSLFTGLSIGGPVAVGLGIVGLRRTRGGAASGRGMAIAGIVTGALATVALVLVAVMIGIAIWGEV